MSTTDTLNDGERASLARMEANPAASPSVRQCLAEARRYSDPLGHICHRLISEADPWNLAVWRIAYSVEQDRAALTARGAARNAAFHARRMAR